MATSSFDGTASDSYGLHQYHSQSAALDQPPSSPPTRSKTSPTEAKRKPTFYQWLWELLSLGVALLSLVGIWAFLREYGGMALPKFPFRITLNTIISLLSEVFSVAITYTITQIIAQAKWDWFGTQPRPLIDFKIFHDAMSGPLGAAVLLMTPRTASSSIATATSFLMILSLAVGPFTQQLVRYESRAIPNGTAIVPRSTTYDAYSPGVILAVKNIDLALKASYYNGLFNIKNPDLFAISPSCPTGNCTWPQYSSLGVCNQCIDSTSSIIKKCPSTGSSSSSCVYSLPGDGPLIYDSPSYSTFFNATSASDKLDDLPFYNSSLAQIRAIAHPGGVAQSGAVAFSCSLYLCIKTYQDSMLSGDFTETVVAMFPNASTPSAESKIVGGRASGTGTTVYPNVTFVPGNEDGVFGGPYEVHGMASVAMSSFLLGSLEGAASGSPGEQSFESDTIQVLFETLMASNSSSLDLAMESIATSLTNSMRIDTASSGSTVINGTAWITETYVSVQWAWILLPVVVVALALLALLGMMWQTHRSGVGCYKSESLAMLFTGLDELKRKH